MPLVFHVHDNKARTSMIWEYAHTPMRRHMLFIALSLLWFSFVTIFFAMIDVLVQVQALSFRIAFSLFASSVLQNSVFPFF